MNGYTELKKFESNLNKITRYLTEGRFNSSEIAVLDAIRLEPKTIKEIADCIGMSKPTVHTCLMTLLRRKHIKILEDKESGSYIYKAINVSNKNILEEILIPLNQAERENFMGYVEILNNYFSEIRNLKSDGVV